VTEGTKKDDGETLHKVFLATEKEAVKAPVSWSKKKKGHNEGVFRKGSALTTNKKKVECEKEGGETLREKDRIGSVGVWTGEGVNGRGEMSEGERNRTLYLPKAGLWNKRWGTGEGGPTAP